MPPAEPARFRLLLLGGTAEARALAQQLACDPRLFLVTSLAGRTRAPTLPPGAVRIGGFGGMPGLVQFLCRERIDAVLDATHPFARQISRAALTACAALDLPYLRLERRPWQPTSSDRWIVVTDVEAALAAACQVGATIFVNLPRVDWPRLASCRAARFILRTVDPHPPFAEHITMVAARPPYTVAGDRELFERMRVDCLLVRNAGGTGAYAKLIAARELGLPVIMIARPPPEVGPWVEDPDAVHLWLDELLRRRRTCVCSGA